MIMQCIHSIFSGRNRLRACVAAVWLAGPLMVTVYVGAQTCTSQAKMTPDLYWSLSDAALGLATAIQSGDIARVQALSSSDVAANFTPTASLIRSTSAKIIGETIKLSQVYQLDASQRVAGDPSEADFSCALSGSTSEVDFAIPALPPGVYAFAIAEVVGPRPWVLALVLRRDAGVWKLAGFSAHVTAVGGHDGRWYWLSAQDALKTQQPWRAWVLFGEAQSLLQPASFVSSTNLDQLIAERRAAAPPEISQGFGIESPLVIKSASSTDYKFTAIASEASTDGQTLDLHLHILAGPSADPAAERAYNHSAAQVLLSAHKELRQGFDTVWVFAESPGQAPFVTDEKITEITP